MIIWHIINDALLLIQLPYSQVNISFKTFQYNLRNSKIMVL